MPEITIDLPDEVLAEVKRRADLVGTKGPCSMTTEVLASLLVKVGLMYSSVPRAVVTTDAPTIDEELEQQQKQRIESLADHLADSVRLYLNKLELQHATQDAESQSVVESLVGAAMATGWVYAGSVISQGATLAELNAAIKVVGDQFDYRISKLNE